MPLKADKPTRMMKKNAPASTRGLGEVVPYPMVEMDTMY